MLDFPVFLASIMLCGMYFAVPNFVNKAIPIWYLGGNCLYENTKYALLLGAGLIFSSGGDVALELDDNGVGSEGDELFITGLLSFLVAHILYIYAFQCVKVAPSKQAPVIGMICIIYYTIIMTLLLPVVEHKLIIPVAIYGLAICAMMFYAANRFFGKSHITYASRYAGLLGALFFVISDTVLALNKFRSPIDNAKDIVMVTYYAAQIFITLSAKYHH